MHEKSRYVVAIVKCEVYRFCMRLYYMLITGENYLRSDASDILADQ